jgi:hypothetical protein
MAKPSRATQAKRSRERTQKERQQEKKELRAVRKEARETLMSSIPDGVDPDLIGIFPGPQPVVEE